MIKADGRLDDAISELQLLLGIVHDVPDVDRLPGDDQHLEVLPLETSGEGERNLR